MSIEPISLPDGYLAHARWWRPREPRGAILYLHGIQSHGGWYEASGARLAAAGFTVLMPDRRGSGLNAAPRGHFDSADQCMSDTRHLLDRLIGETGVKSAHVVGVSWGGKQAVYLAMARPEIVRTISLIAPGLFPRVDLTHWEKLRVGMAMVNDRERHFDIPLNEARFFTANPARLAYLERDTHKLLKVSAAFLLASRRLDRAVRPFHESPYRGGIHLFLAGRDRIIDNAATRAWLDAQITVDRTITEYATAEHTLEFEANTDPYFSDLVDWISSRA